ncbi:MAG: hypothetical protein KTR31_32130 [Myxococcales bacterium]|nr:hypothetical protein [Myxococcales bacterium]
MIWLVTTVLAQTTGQTASTAATADTSVGFVRTALHDKLEVVHLVVHAEVKTSAGVTLQGGKRAWVQTLEVLEAFHEDHSRTALSVGSTISFFSWYDDSLPSTALSHTAPAARLPVGEDGVYFLLQDNYTDASGVSHEAWYAHFERVQPHVLHSVRLTNAGSVVAPIDYGGTTGKIAGTALHGRSILRNDAGIYDWITRPVDLSLPHVEQRIETATAGASGMPWATFLVRVRTAAGEL